MEPGNQGTGKQQTAQGLQPLPLSGLTCCPSATSLTAGLLSIPKGGVCSPLHPFCPEGSAARSTSSHPVKHSLRLPGALVCPVACPLAGWEMRGAVRPVHQGTPSQTPGSEQTPGFAKQMNNT